MIPLQRRERDQLTDRSVHRFHPRVHDRDEHPRHRRRDRALPFQRRPAAALLPLEAELMSEMPNCCACRSGAACATFPAMSTLAEIEEAVQMLPAPQQKTLLRRLVKRLGKEDSSCYDLTRELFEKPGRLGASGKRDLSTNKARLAGFGLARQSSK